MLDEDIGEYLGEETSGPAFSLSVSSDLLSSERNASRRLFYVSLLAQGGALLAAKTAVAPLDRVKILRQVEDRQKTLFSDRHWYRGFRYHMQHLVIGNLSRMYMLSNIRNESEIYSYAISAFLASSLAYPWDVRYILAATDRKMIGNFSWRANFVGFSYHTLATPIFLASSVGFLKATSNFQVDEKKFPINIILGSVAALVGTVATFPIDTLRRRAIVGNLSKKFLFSGVSMSLIKAVPECFVLGVVYSELLKLKYL